MLRGGEGGLANLQPYRIRVLVCGVKENPDSRAPQVASAMREGKRLFEIGIWADWKLPAAGIGGLIVIRRESGIFCLEVRPLARIKITSRPVGSLPSR